MTQFLRPMFTFVLGLALALYGILHTALSFPSGEEIGTFWSSLPHTGAVLLFMLGLIALGVGILLLLSAIRGMRLRFRQIRSSYATPRHDHDDNERDPEDWESQYAYR